MKCPSCQKDCVKRGFRKTGLGRKQMFLCVSCRKKFTPEWPRMRYKKEDVMHAVGLYKKGLSAGKIRSQLESEGIVVSRWTIIKWHNRFG